MLTQAQRITILAFFALWRELFARLHMSLTSA